MGRLLVLVAVLALAYPATASAWTKQDGTTTMADGVTIATTLYLPSGPPPAGGWPAILMAHGLGDTRATTNALAERLYVSRDYVVLTYDARGHGASGGVVDVDGPAEVGDVKALFRELVERADVSDGRVGGWGISYGGGAMLRAAGEGTAFGALNLFETWSDLYAALFPQNLPKSGVILGFLSSITRPSPLIASVRDAAVGGTNLAVLREASAVRSSRSLLGSVSVPTFWAQGKRDYAFDLEQATSAFRLLRGPKRLWLGNLGHAPSAFASDDFAAFSARGADWYDRFLKGTPNGIDAGGNVEVAPTPYREAGVRRYAGLPPTASLLLRPRFRARTIGAQGKVVAAAPALPRGVELFGSASVNVTARARGRWPQLVAVLSSGQTVLATGGIPTPQLGTRPRKLTIRLSAWAAPVAKGTRLTLTLAQTSTAQDPGTPVYLLAKPAGRLTVTKVSLDVPVLR
ncbi:MAG TPA: alpha/beta fold hydrolase [Gaiellaceae bacterium]|nr:alpha/beta fold hydrolase [Gaiellaceae bacterium]